MESKGMKFAKQIMKNLGWTEGSGLGLNEDGITQPLKPTAKFDVSGLGHQNYNGFQWWDHAFNKAAKAFDIKVTDDDGVVVEKNKNIGKIRTKREAMVDADTLAYGKFCKTGTLNNGIMEASSTTLTIKEEKDYSLKLSDEELFKLCDGLTAHKGARHGLTASGKLARIAKQEALMLASLNSSTTTHKPANVNVTVDTSSEISVKREKKKKHKAAESVDAVTNFSSDNKEEQDIVLIPENETFEEIRPKKKKYKSKQATQELGEEEQISTENCQLLPTAPLDEDQPTDKAEKRKKKKKNKDKTDNENVVELPLVQEETVLNLEEPKKKKKKNKHKHQDV